MRIACFGDSLTAGRPGSSYVAKAEELMPNDTWLNFGRRNDTVVSLNNRISSMKFSRSFDAAFLWIGVNDVPQTDSWTYHAFHRLLGKRRARDTAEFTSCYLSVVTRLSRASKRLIVAPPALKGEELENPWNRRLAELSNLIKEQMSAFEGVEFLDLQRSFAQALAGKTVSDYIARNLIRVLLDTLTLRTDSQVDARATERGLHLTLDGVHLNSVGARLVAGDLAAAIGSTSPAED